MFEKDKKEKLKEKSRTLRIEEGFEWLKKKYLDIARIADVTSNCLYCKKKKLEL